MTTRSPPVAELVGDLHHSTSWQTRCGVCSSEIGPASLNVMACAVSCGYAECTPCYLRRVLTIHGNRVALCQRAAALNAVSSDAPRFPTPGLESRYQYDSRYVCRISSVALTHEGVVLDFNVSAAQGTPLGRLRDPDGSCLLLEFTRPGSSALSTVQLPGPRVSFSVDKPFHEIRGSMAFALEKGAVIDALVAGSAALSFRYADFDSTGSYLPVPILNLAAVSGSTNLSQFPWGASPAEVHARRMELFPAPQQHAPAVYGDVAAPPNFQLYPPPTSYALPGDDFDPSTGKSSFKEGEQPADAAIFKRDDSARDDPV